VITGDVDFECSKKIFYNSIWESGAMTITMLLKYILARKMKLPKQLEDG
jgi:hypothetical protein